MDFQRVIIILSWALSPFIEKAFCQTSILIGKFGPAIVKVVYCKLTFLIEESPKSGFLYGENFNQENEVLHTAAPVSFHIFHIFHQFTLVTLFIFFLSARAASYHPLPASAIEFKFCNIKSKLPRTFPARMPAARALAASLLLPIEIFIMKRVRCAHYHQGVFF